MTKKSKILILLLLMLVIALNPIKKVDAHSIELDPESLITMPIMITNGKGNVKIKQSVTNLYYILSNCSNS